MIRMLRSCSQFAVLVSAASLDAGIDQPVAFSTGFSSDMVLQRAPAKAALYGFSTGAVSVHVVGIDGASSAVDYTVSAQPRANDTWKAFLLPHSAGGSYTITASSGSSSTTLDRVTMGDVYFCSGQSNMALSTYYTFSADTVRAEFAKETGAYSMLRVFQFGGMSMNATLAAYTPQYATATQSVATEPLRGSWYNASTAVTVVTEPSSARNMTAFDTFSATCLYFGVELIDALGSDTKIPIGLIQSAVGGSTIEAWMSNESRAECTQRMTPKAGIGGGKGMFPFMQHQPGVLYYGYVAPFVNMSISGFVWYQGENNCGMANVGNSAEGTGYGCELHTMVQHWRAIWAATPSTTLPLAPFGIATLAAGGSEGNDGHMANMRWSETANYGVWDNPKLPNTFGAQLYDLGDPYGHSGMSDGNELTPAGNETRCCATFENCQHPAHNWSCTAKQNATNNACVAQGHDLKACSDKYYCANPNPKTGKYGPECSKWNSSLWWGTLKAIEPLVRQNSPSGVVANNFMGGIHPRLKRPVGRRLAHAIVQLVPGYRDIVVASGMSRGSAKTGPTLAGCSLNEGGSSLELHFNKSLLGSEALMLRPFDADMSNWAWRYDSSHQRLNKTDSLGLMVCTASADEEASLGNETTCQCSTWATLQLATGQSILYCQHGPGWKPPAAMIEKGKHVKVQTNPFATQWTSLAVYHSAGSYRPNETRAREGIASLSVDLAPLAGRKPIAVRLAWPMFPTRVGSADDMCCVHASQIGDQSDARFPGPQGGTEVCVPGNCPIYSSLSELPANPFFAAIEDGKCKCEAPQVCDA